MLQSSIKMIFDTFDDRKMDKYDMDEMDKYDMDMDMDEMDKSDRKMDMDMDMDKMDKIRVSFHLAMADLLRENQTHWDECLAFIRRGKVDVDSCMNLVDKLVLCPLINTLCNPTSSSSVMLLNHKEYAMIRSLVSMLFKSCADAMDELGKRFDKSIDMLLERCASGNQLATLDRCHTVIHLVGKLFDMLRDRISIPCTVQVLCKRLAYKSKLIDICFESPLSDSAIYHLYLLALFRTDTMSRPLFANIKQAWSIIVNDASVIASTPLVAICHETIRQAKQTKWTRDICSKQSHFVDMQSYIDLVLDSHDEMARLPSTMISSFQ